ncbi:type VII secretion protein EccCa [Mycobacterium neglectum]|uniref:type VII secretion protein EccCa n=1 Tax=Mycobacterium neglectum TaxID=242737 RepID=UPI000BFEE9E2|nr:type VII secretion protein EccCa [Mycobacterium neglectum]
MDFVRVPRVPVPPVAHVPVVVDAPPQIPAATPANLLARLLPVAMLAAAIGMMAVYFTSGAQTTRNPMYLFFPVMMLTSVIGTLVYSARGTNRTAEINRDRQKYLNYLDTLDRAATSTADGQRHSLQWCHPEPRALWTLAGSRRMWERRPEDPDYCLLRVGIGDQPLSTALIEPDLSTVDEPDPVTVSAMRSLIRSRSTLVDTPITLALLHFSVITVDGDAQAARALLRSLICQLAILHGPDHIVIGAVAGAESSNEWDWLKWLPHHRHVLPEGGVEQRHVVMVLDGGDSSALESGLDEGNSTTVIEVGMSLVPAASPRRLHLYVDAGIVAVRAQDGDEVTARPDLISITQASACARRLTQYRSAVDGRAEAHGWFDMMGIDRDRLDPEKYWKAAADGHIRAVPIGVAEDGTRVHLDINEAARNGMGPHGLCVGATGSGKSELLRTLALGMITSHPPDVLNLILVDFKGGATFLGLERASHVGAVITNLAGEAHLVSRMNDALAGEMNRRQELLRTAGGLANLAEYRRARSRGAGLPPLPALFILVDEFSELLSQHPDFAELFVAIGRLGRSLGMHLLLASQRLDEGRLRGLETHLSYRICLKTFSAGESRAVLGVPDAYHLPTAPGVAYLKSASGDLVRFQTAFVSGPDDERRDTSVSSAPAIPRVFTRVQSRFSEPVETKQFQQPARTVLDGMLDRLAGQGRPAHQVWLPPLTQSPTLDALMPGRGQRRLTVPIGVMDNPYQQRRDPLVVELDGPAGNVAIVGAPRSGKSTALCTMLLALARHHDPADVGFYCLDFGGGALSSMRRLPHVGSMAGRSDVDLCRRTVAAVASMLQRRESSSRRGDDPFSDVFLVIDGWATLRQEFDYLEGPITAIAAQGLSFGIHVVIAASRWAEVRPALKDQIATRIELRLGDPSESEMDRKRARDLSARPAGRGIAANRLEFAIAIPRFDGETTTRGLAEAIAVECERLRDRWAPNSAPVVQLLPRQIPCGDLAVHDRQPGSHVLIGIGENELKPVHVDFAEQSHLIVLGETGCGKTAMLRLLCRQLIRTNTADEAQLEIVDYRRTLLGVVESEHLGGYAMSPSSLTSRLPAIVGRLEARMPGENVTQQQLRTRSWWSGPDIYLIVDDYDLVAGATGNPLAPLTDFLPHAADLGLHVVVARRSGGAARAMFDPVLARMRELGAMGLMMSASPEEGVLLGTVRPSALPPGRGTLITRRADQLIQVAWTDPP